MPATQRPQVASKQMDSRGPFTFGDIPDDTDSPDDEDIVHWGWIAPEDRLWKHPSEVSGLEHGIQLRQLQNRAALAP